MSALVVEVRRIACRIATEHDQEPGQLLPGSYTFPTGTRCPWGKIAPERFCRDNCKHAAEVVLYTDEATESVIATLIQRKKERTRE